MPAEIRLEVNGHRDAALTARAIEGIAHAIHRLPFATRAAIVDPAIAQAAGIIVRRARTPNLRFIDRTGRLRKSIRVRKIRGAYNGVPRLYTNVIAGGQRGSHQAFIIEEGTENRFAGAGRRTRARSNRRTSIIRRALDAERLLRARESGGLRARGNVGARKFLATAVDESENEVLQSVVSYGRAKLDEMTAVARKGTGLRK